MGGLIRFLLRLVFFLAGVVVAASLLAVVLAIALVWALRYGWARLTGRAVQPLVMRVDPMGSWRRFSERASSQDAQDVDAVRGPSGPSWKKDRAWPQQDDVVDVRAKDVPPPVNPSQGG